MEQWNWIRQRVLRDGVSIRQIKRETGLHRKTISKVLACSSPPEFRCPARDKPKLGAYVDRIAAILQAEKDEHIPPKQRHTAKLLVAFLVEVLICAADALFPSGYPSRPPKVQIQ